MLQQLSNLPFSLRTQTNKKTTREYPFLPMKAFTLSLGFLVFFSILGLKLYFLFVPPPAVTLASPLAEIIPQEIEGWTIEDFDLATSAESSDRIASFLNLDDSLYRIFQKGSTRVGVYVAYWTPGKVSYRWAGAHTPDTCWVVNGWTRTERKYAIPFSVKDQQFKKAEFGIYEKDNTVENVYFWHLVGGQPFGYAQKEVPNIFGSLIDIQKYGLNLRQEQFFIRLSSNQSLETLSKIDGFDQIIEGLAKLSLADTPLEEAN